MSIDKEAALATAVKAAQAGGEQLLAYQGKLSRVRAKSSSGDLVTEADEASEAAVLSVIRSAYPLHAILAEESGLSAEGHEYMWSVDPLDGTLNYAHGLPFFCVSIGLLHHHQPILGVIWIPRLNELFCAAQGLGATLNDEPIQVSEATTLSQSLLATGFPYRKRELTDNNYAEFCYLADLTQDIRRPGSAALDLAYVACGRFEGFWEQHLNSWDITAGAILVREAGGQVSGYDGGPLQHRSGQIIATNGHIHAPLQQALQQVRNAGIHGRITP